MLKDQLLSYIEKQRISYFFYKTLIEDLNSFDQLLRFLKDKKKSNSSDC